MTSDQKKLLEICKKLIKDDELTQAVEIIDALLRGDQVVVVPPRGTPGPFNDTLSVWNL